MSSPWHDMPPAIDPDASFGSNWGAIPPPPGATLADQGGYYNPFPGAPQNNAAAPYPPTPGFGSSWPAAPIPAPTWAGQTAPGTPHASQEWPSYTQYPPTTPPAWGAPTPPASWGVGTPGGSLGPATPASAYHPTHSPWVQGHLAGDSAFGQPIASSPWFGGGASPGLGGSGPQRKKKKRKSRQQPFAMQGPPSPFAQGHSPFPGQPQYGMQQQQQPYGFSEQQGEPSGLVRAHTYSASPGSHLGLRRTASLGLNEEPPPYAQGDVYNERNLARRPRDWRADYHPQGGLASYMPRVGKSRSDVKEYSDPVKRTLHPLLLYTTPTPPIWHDLRDDPLGLDTLEFLKLQRPHNDLDFAQLAVQPSASMLRLYHPRLPWYVDIGQTHPNGVTVFDVLFQLHGQLRAQISGRHYWNEELGSVERADLGLAFHDRCDGDPEEVAQGVRQVDFLGRKVVLEGLARGKNGMWEIKTGKVE